MANVFHKDFTLDDNHALHAREYADIAARDADTAFNGDAANIGKAVLITSPPSVFSLLSTAPLFLEFSNTTAGNVTTSDTLIAAQLLLGNGANDIVTEPDLTYDGGVFTVAGIQTLIDSADVRIRDHNITIGNVSSPTDLTADGGGLTLLGDTDKTILWSTAANTWEVSDGWRVPFLSITGTLLHMTSGAFWNADGIEFPVNNSLSFDGDTVISDNSGIVTLSNIDQLDLTTQLNIENAMTQLANLTSIQSLPIALADAGTDAVFGWADGGNTYRNLTPAEVLAIIGIGAGAGIVTTSDTLAADQLLLGNGGSDIVTESDLVWTGTRFGVGIASPVSTLHMLQNDTEIDGNAGLTIEQLGTGDAMLHMMVPDMRWIMGVDNSDGDKFKINDDDSFQIGGAITISPVTQYTGLGANIPVTRLHVLSIEADTRPIVSLTNTGTNGAFVQHFVGTRDPEGLVTGFPGDLYYRDNGTDSSIFIHKGATTGNVGWAEVITGTAGNVTTSDTLAATQLLTGNGGTDIVTEPKLLFDGSSFKIDISGTFVAPKDIADNIIIQEDDDSGIMIFSGSASTGHIIFGDTTNRDRGRLQYDHDSNALSLYTNGMQRLTIESIGMVGIGIDLPISRLHVYENNTLVDATVGVTIEQDGIGDAVLQFLLTGGQRWVAGIDNSNNGNFKIQSGASLQTDAQITITSTDFVGINKETPESSLHVRNPVIDDTLIILALETEGKGKIGFRTGDRTPEGNVLGTSGDVYFADRGELSGSYENREAGANTNWLKRSVLPSDFIQILNSAEFDDLASGGIVSFTADTTLLIRGQIVTSNRIVVTNGARLSISGGDGANSKLTYSGTDTFITSNGFVELFSGLQLISTSTGTCYDISGPFSILIFRGIFIDGWDSMGTIEGGNGIFGIDTGHFNIVDGYDIIDVRAISIKDCGQIGATFNGVLYKIKSKVLNTFISFTDTLGIDIGASGALFDLDTRLDNTATVKVTSSSVAQGNIFKKSILTDATINSVADGSPATGTIAAMADNGSGGTTISSTTTYFEDEEVTITGTTSYDGTFQIFNVVAGVSFDTITTFVADDAAGSVDSDRIVMSLAGGHGISAGDSTKVIGSNFYNGFYTVLDESLDDIVVNNAFVETDTGSIERELSLDESDPRVSAFNNFGISDSAVIACAHVNDNNTVNGAIVNDTFTDMVFGTTGVALRASSSMERWKLVDELNGTFEYFGQEPFDGRITFDFTVLSTGATVDFRFRWMIDRGVGFVDLDDPVEALVAVGGNAQSVTKTYPLAAAKGDKIKPQITRNSGGSDITATFVTIYVSM